MIKVSENCVEGVIFMLTKDEVLACAKELGISKEQVGDNIIELVKTRVSLGLGHWPEVVKSALREAIICPLGLVCYPSCFWWQDAKCRFPGKGE